jgi:hypothetical protein
MIQASVKATVDSAMQRARDAVMAGLPSWTAPEVQALNLPGGKRSLLASSISNWGQPDRWDMPGSVPPAHVRHPHRKVPSTPSTSADLKIYTHPQIQSGSSVSIDPM